MASRGRDMTDLATTLVVDQERRIQMGETRQQTITRHKALFSKGSTFPDSAFTKEKGVRRTWVVRIIEAMVKEPGVWFERITYLNEEGANPRAAKDQASTFNAASARATGSAKKNEPSQVKFLREHGGHFEAEYTPTPVNTTGGPVVVMRVRYFPPESKRGQFA